LLQQNVMWHLPE